MRAIVAVGLGVMVRVIVGVDEGARKGFVSGALCDCNQDTFCIGFASFTFRIIFNF